MLMMIAVRFVIGFHFLVFSAFIVAWAYLSCGLDNLKGDDEDVLSSTDLTDQSGR